MRCSSTKSAIATKENSSMVIREMSDTYESYIGRSCAKSDTSSSCSILWYDSDENQREYQSDFASWHRLEARMSSLEKNLLSIRLAKLFFTLTSQEVQNRRIPKIDKTAPNQ